MVEVFENSAPELYELLNVPLVRRSDFYVDLEFMRKWGEGPDLISNSFVFFSNICRFLNGKYRVFGEVTFDSPRFDQVGVGILAPWGFYCQQKGFGLSC